MEQITCVISDDHGVVREGVRIKLERARGIVVLGDAHDGPSTMDLLRETRPDVAIVDLRLPGLDGMQIAAQVREEELPTRVIIHSAHATHHLAERALANGALGYVSKEADPDMLVGAVRSVARGRRYIDPLIAAEAYESGVPDLSDRETEILSLMAEGLPNQGIAARLEISPDTVKSHVSRILIKLDADSRAHAVATAFRRSLVV